MKVVRLDINNFRGIKAATLHFDDHTLLIGMNNVGKSTICEALELVLGRDRLKRFPPVEEFDFYNARYRDDSVDPPIAIPIEIEVVLTELPEELANKCAEHTEFWHSSEKRILEKGEIDDVDDDAVYECLRIKTVAKYNQEEDEFEAESIFCGGAVKAHGEWREVPRHIRSLFSFLYLRTLRTGSRALSLERGSLLDIILQQHEIRTGIWENTIRQLRELDPPIDEGAANLISVLDNIEKRLAQYIPLGSQQRATQLFVSQLTREHLRKTIAFFLRTAAGQEPVPFQEAGTGTLNTLVLALLSFIAEMKKDTVIFAMEEPEIALPPHTQRRIAKYLLESTSQCFMTTHSPYVIERFEPEQIQILRKDNSGLVTATGLTVGATLKGKTYRRHARRGIAEAMLGRGVIIGEGLTEKDMILATAEKMEEANPDKYYPLDLAGVSVICVDGDGSLAEFGEFFKTLQIKPFAFYDAKTKKPVDAEKLKAAFFNACQTKYLGAEKLLTEEIPPARLWQLLEEIRDNGDRSIPAGKMPAPDIVKKTAFSILKNDKGCGYAGRLIEMCKFKELPATVVAFLESVYTEFPKPEPVPSIDAEAEASPGPEDTEGVPGEDES
ncbi:MAG: ATP-dependent nuclease [Phycisphaerae bacterium]